MTPQTLSKISWRDLCPWLMLGNAVAIAIRPTVLITAFLGLLLSPLGWQLSEMIFLDDSQIVGGDPAAFMESEVTGEEESAPTPARKQIGTMAFWEETPANTWFTGLPTLDVFFKFGIPHLHLIDPYLNLRQTAYSFFGLIWTLLVWSLCGGMICRVAATQFARDERIGIVEAFRFCWKRYLIFLTASATPLALIIVFAIPFLFVGIFIRLDLFLLLAGFGWFLILLLGLAMAVLLIPLFFGWIFLWPAIATENADPFESVSRGYSYPTQKPFHYLFYLIVILTLGFLASWIVATVGNKSIELTHWGTSWGAGMERVEQIELSKRLPLNEEDATSAIGSGTPSDQDPDEATAAWPAMRIFSAHTVAFWEKSVVILTLAYNYAFFFVGATGMYLLLRRDTDQTELDEIFLEAPPAIDPLPDLKTAEPEATDDSESEKTESSPEPSPAGEGQSEPSNATTEPEPEEPTEQSSPEPTNSEADSDEEPIAIDEEDESDDEGPKKEGPSTGPTQ